MFVGIGSGAIQLGLWSYYAHLSGMKVVLVEVDDKKVQSVRSNKNSYFINIAYFDKIISKKIGPVEIYNPKNTEERKKILDYISVANDIVTAVPSTSIYEKGGIAELLKKGLNLRKENKPVMVYASENQINAARMLEKLIYPQQTPSCIQFSDTVIARMGGPQCDSDLIKKLNLQYLTLDSKEAFLVEDFHSIIVEKCKIPEKHGFKTGFSMFQPVENIHIYEERKLFGHNAVHFLLAAIGKLKGYEFMSDYAGDTDFEDIGVDVLRKETGGWFKKKYKQSEEETTTEDSYESWVVQLCQRIKNPFLYDVIDRVIRNTERKLAWNDRIIGTIRNALSAGIIPKRYAIGVASALLLYCPGKSLEYQKNLTKQEALSNLQVIWEQDRDKEARFRKEILNLVGNAFDVIKRWKKDKDKNLYLYLKQIGYLNQ